MIEYAFFHCFDSFSTSTSTTVLLFTIDVVLTIPIQNEANYEQALA